MMLAVVILLLVEALTAAQVNLKETPGNCTFQEYDQTAQRDYPDWCGWTSRGWRLNTMPGNTSNMLLSYDHRFSCAHLQSEPFCSSHKNICMTFLYLFEENNTLTLNIYIKPLESSEDAVKWFWTASNSAKLSLSRGQIPLPREDNLTVIIEVQPQRNSSKAKTVYIDDILFVERDSCFLFPKDADPGRSKSPVENTTNETSAADAFIKDSKFCSFGYSGNGTTLDTTLDTTTLSSENTTEGRKTSSDTSQLSSATSIRGTFASATTLSSEKTTEEKETSRTLTAPGTSQLPSAMTPESTRTRETNASAVPQTDNPSGNIVMNSVIAVVAVIVVVIVVGLVLFIRYRRKRLAVSGEESKTARSGTDGRGPGHDSEAGDTLQSTGRKSQNVSHQASENGGGVLSQNNESNADHGTHVYAEPSSSAGQIADPASPGDLDGNHCRAGTPLDNDRKADAAPGDDNIYTDIAESDLIGSSKAQQNDSDEKSYYDALNLRKSEKREQKGAASETQKVEAMIYSHLQWAEDGVYNEVSRQRKPVVLDDVYSHTT